MQVERLGAFRKGLCTPGFFVKNAFINLYQVASHATLLLSWVSLCVLE